MEHRFTSSGIEIEEVYGPEGDAPGLGRPGSFPYTRGPYRSMYRGRPWTMRQYAGFGTATETNSRFRELLSAGQTGLSVAFDLPTQMGYDSDHPAASGEVGKVGVAIDTLHDMQTLFDGLPLDEVSTSMTINATAPILLLMYQLVAEAQGVSADRIRGTIQNDILKEYIARGTYIYPPAASMRLVTDLFEYCAQELPSWNTISISGYHIREAGSTAVQEVAFTLANGLAYVEAAQRAGLDVDDFAPRLSFFWNAHNHLFEEAAKFRAARRLWARLMRDVVGARRDESCRMRFHTQTAGSTLTAQQPHNNIVRTTVQALAATLGGTQSLHTNSFDEALGLPTRESATLALRTQQILAHENGVTDTVDPLAGSFYVEHLTDEIEAAARELIDQIQMRGGAVAAIDEGFQQRLIEDAAYEAARALESQDMIVVGVNEFQEAGQARVPLSGVDHSIEAEQIDTLTSRKAARPHLELEAALSSVQAAATGDQNVLPPIKDALAVGGSVGEISDVLRRVFGEYRPSR